MAKTQETRVVLTYEDKRLIAQELLDTGSSTALLEARYRVSEDDIKSAALDNGVVECARCGFWVKSDEVSGDEECEGCRGE